jgi:hypothetical protein
LFKKEKEIKAGTFNNDMGSQSGTMVGTIAAKVEEDEV